MRLRQAANQGGDGNRFHNAPNGFRLQRNPGPTGGNESKAAVRAAIYFAHHVATVLGIAFYNVASTRLPGQLAGNIIKSEFSPFTAYSAAAEPVTLGTAPTLVEALALFAGIALTATFGYAP
jgi:hypothetical protein